MGWLTAARMSESGSIVVGLQWRRRVLRMQITNNVFKDFSAAAEDKTKERRRGERGHQTHASDWLGVLCASLFASRRRRVSMDEFVGGVASGCVEVSLMQPTVYLKNASQQNLPLTMRPQLLYRGISTNLVNMAVLTGLQFPLTSLARKSITRGEQRELTGGEQVASGFIGGVLSGFVCCPLELTIINQQLHAGGTLAAMRRLTQEYGASVLFRGLDTASLREGIFTAGYLGLGPVAAQHLRKHYGLGQVQSEMGGAIFAGVLAASLSHPVDTIKTCMQGDPGRTTYATVLSTTRRLLAEGGVSAFFRGAQWRVGRTIFSFFIIGKCRDFLHHMGFIDI